MVARLGSKKGFLQMSKSNKSAKLAVVANEANNTELPLVAVEANNEPTVEPTVEPVAEPVAPAVAAKAPRAYKADGVFAKIWAYLADPANAEKDTKAMRADLLALGINRSTVNCQLTRHKLAGGNRQLANAYGRSKATGQALAAKLAAPVAS